MSVTSFGSCRIKDIPNNNNLNINVNYTHSTKEVIQQIKFFSGNLFIPPPLDILCFRSAILKNTPITYNPNFKLLFDKSDVCVIEICSKKLYMCNGFYLHHICVKKKNYMNENKIPKNITDNIKCIQQTPAEIEEDILEIKRMLAPRKVIFVTHYNAIHKKKYIESRNDLVKILTAICQKYNLPLVNPAQVLKPHAQDKVISRDLAHYTHLGRSNIVEHINNKIIELRSTGQC